MAVLAIIPINHIFNVKLKKLLFRILDYRAMKYVYILRSIGQPGQRYFGITSNLRHRLADHNAGKSPHTAPFRPWILETYVAFTDHKKAAAFERYIKQGSGWAFAKKHLWSG